MEEIILEIVQSGAYSAVFAVLLFIIIKYNAKREEYYSSVIRELCDALGVLDNMGSKLDDILRACTEIKSKQVRRKAVKECD